MAHHSRSSRDHRRSREYASSSREYTTEKRRSSRDDRGQALPRYNHNGQEVNHNGHVVTKGMHPDGESGRRGFNPLKFLVICGRSSNKLSMLCNLLWPLVPVAIALVRRVHGLCVNIH